MIEYQTGDLLAADVEALVNTVNCVGVMGKGIALQFKKSFPDNFKKYARACKGGEIEPGRMFITEQLGVPKYIVNFPTKRHWRAKSQMADVESGLAALANEVQARQIRSIAIPPLGSGLGGLDWSEVRSRIEDTLGQLPDVRVVVYEPERPPDAKVMARLIEAPEITPGRASLVTLMHKYMIKQLEPVMTPQEVHELMYFLQAAGEPLDLLYAKGHKGLYAEGIHRVLNKIEGHWISGYSDTIGKPSVHLRLIPGAVTGAEVFLRSEPNTNKLIRKVVDLIDGFEAPVGLELLAVVHWASHKEQITSIDTIVHHVNDGRFYRKQIVQAYEALESMGWLHDEGIPSQEINGTPAFAAEKDASNDVIAEKGYRYSLIDIKPTLININTATADELETLPRIGGKLAQAIIARRETKGYFLTTQDIVTVSGIGNGLYKSIADLITVGHHLL